MSEVAALQAVFTVIRPEVAPVGTVAVMVVAETTVNEVAGTPPKETFVTPVKSLPLMVTVAPGAADAGEKDDMVGGAGAGVIGKLPYLFRR